MVIFVEFPIKSGIFEVQARENLAESHHRHHFVKSLIENASRMLESSWASCLRMVLTPVFSVMLNQFD